MIVTIGSSRLTRQMSALTVESDGRGAIPVGALGMKDASGCTRRVKVLSPEQRATIEAGFKLHQEHYHGCTDLIMHAGR